MPSCGVAPVAKSERRDHEPLCPLAAGVGILERSTYPGTIATDEMSVRCLLQKVGTPIERFQVSLEAGAKWMLTLYENRWDLGDVPDQAANRIQPVFCMDPINVAIRAMALEQACPRKRRQGPQVRLRRLLIRNDASRH